MTLQEVIKELQKAPNYLCAERKALPGMGFYLRQLAIINGIPEYGLFEVSRHAFRGKTNQPLSTPTRKQKRYPGVSARFTDWEILADDWQAVGQENEEVTEVYHFGTTEEE
jgi:hypothetical protein